MTAAKKRRRILPFIFKTFGLLILLVTCWVFATPLWNRYVVYPRMEDERSTLRTLYQDPKRIISAADYQDSRGTLAEILPAAKQAHLDFIFLADHRIADQDTFPRGIQGTFDGVLIESGTESPGASMMVTPLRPTILDWKKDRSELIKEVVDHGGMVFYLHSEDNSHDWANPDYQGMEIYNIHTDLKDEKNPLAFLVNGMINSGKHRHWAYRELFDEQHQIVALWDSLNTKRRIVGMAAVDAHNNQNIRARYMNDGKVEWVGNNAKTIRIKEAGWLEKILFDKPDAGGWVFKMELDTYFHSFNFVNTHIFADTLSSRSLKNALIKGHAYISFENLAPAKGFEFYTTDQNGLLNGIMGDSVRTKDAGMIRGVTPYPARFELYRSGKLIDTKENSYDYTFAPGQVAGNYRLVARLNFNGQSVPWIYTNPIYIW
jgi:hypothetical protein